VTGDPLASAISAAQIGGEVLRTYFGELKPGEITEKARNDWVSTADRAAEQAITAYLRERTPEYGFLAEEAGASGAVGARWVIDPLDGTLNFVRGFPHFAVSVALVVDGRTEVGAVYDPMRDEMFAARRGGGATRNGVPIRVTGRDGLAGAFVTTGFPFRVHRYLDTFLAVFRETFMRVAALRRPGAAALDLAHTAAGIFDAFFEFCLSPWDIAAGGLIVTEAGGVVSNLDGGGDIFTNGNVVAGSPAVHAELLALVQKFCREADIRP